MSFLQHISLLCHLSETYTKIHQTPYDADNFYKARMAYFYAMNAYAEGAPLCNRLAIFK